MTSADRPERETFDTVRETSEPARTSIQFVASPSVPDESKSASYAHLQQRVLLAEHNYNQIVQSTSWKITAPLRRFFQRFPLLAKWCRRSIKLVWWTITLQLSSRLRQRRAVSQLDFGAEAAPAAMPALIPSSDRARGDPAGGSQPAGEGSAPADSALERSYALRLAHLEVRYDYLNSIVASERQRLDYALMKVEGRSDEIDRYHQARRQPGYRLAFEQSQPLVSVCVTTVNRADLLIDRCLRSLINQSYENLQIVVVGDHCTDDTGSRIARLRDDRIVFHNLATRGPYPPPGIDRWRVAGTNALNAALSRCNGDFIAHLDDDDCATSDRIETLVAAAIEHRADFCWHPFWTEAADGQWQVLGNGEFELGQMTTGSIFYHRYFKRVPWDILAYRMGEPGDWNRLRKIRSMRPKCHFVDRPLMFHYTEGSQTSFTRRHGEAFLE